MVAKLKEKVRGLSQRFGTKGNSADPKVVAPKPEDLVSSRCTAPLDTCHNHSWRPPSRERSYGTSGSSLNMQRRGHLNFYTHIDQTVYTLLLQLPTPLKLSNIFGVLLALSPVP